MTDLPTLSNISEQNPYLSIYLKPEEGTPSWGEPPPIGHYRENPPPGTKEGPANGFFEYGMTWK